MTLKILQFERLLMDCHLLVDIPMSRVKFNVNTEYSYLQNFKILQSMLSPDTFAWNLRF